jgi:26S proteasome regulatory subunit N6
MSTSAADTAKAVDLSTALTAATELTDASAAATALRAIALATPDADGPECVKVREAAVAALCANRTAARDGPGLAGLLTDLRPLFAAIPKAKTAKLVRGVIDAIAKVPGSEGLQVRSGRAKTNAKKGSAAPHVEGGRASRRRRVTPTSDLAWCEGGECQQGRRRSARSLNVAGQRWGNASARPFLSRLWACGVVAPQRSTGLHTPTASRGGGGPVAQPVRPCEIQGEKRTRPPPKNARLFFEDPPPPHPSPRGAPDPRSLTLVSTSFQLSVCREVSAWARSERRTFLRQRVDARLASLLLSTGGAGGRPDPGGALALLAPLLSEVKRLDDKLMLVEVHLLESRAHATLRNLPKARAALTAARSAANSVYVPPSLQAEIDGQSGGLHADERDYKTAFSYFYEAFEARAALAGGSGASVGGSASGHAPPAAAGDPATAAATAALASMLLCKVMTGDPADVPGLIAAKAGVRFAGPAVDALAAVATAAADRSLEGLAAARAAYPAHLDGDPFIGSHLARLADGLLQSNLLRLAEPFSRVQVGHLASLIGLPHGVVLAKLSQMILDGACAGTLDSEADCLELFEEGGPEAEGGAYAAAADAFAALGGAVDALAARAAKVAA